MKRPRRPPAMPSDQFRGALRMLGLTHQQAAPLLGVSAHSVASYSSGRMPVPGPVAVLIRNLVAEALTGRPQAHAVK